MSLEDSPSLEEYSLGMPPEPPDRSTARKRLWSIIGVLALAALVLGGVAFLRSQAGAILTGTGTVAGHVLDENGQPLNAEIYVLGTKINAKTDASGSFLIQGVPAGARSVVIANSGWGSEYPVQVVPGQVSQLGEIKFVTTQEPPE